MLIKSSLVFMVVVLLPVLALPGDHGVCSAHCSNAGASCVVDMEFKIAACGKCEAGTTVYESCYVPNGQCSKICQNAGKTCEVGRDDSSSECGKCLDAKGVDKSLDGSSCEPLPRGKCDTRCTKALSACTPNPSTPPQECGSCPGVKSAVEVCRSDYGQCSTKCRNSGASCVPSSTNIPKECGGCARGTTPSESCTPPGANGVCNDVCTRPRAKCARAADGVVATMPVECGGCATNASAACLPDEQCRISMADAQGKELVPTRITGTMTAQYDVTIKPNTPNVLHVIVLHADKSCGATEAMAPPKVTVQDAKNSDKVVTAVTEEQAPATGGRQFAITITVPAGAGARYKINVDSCCAALQMNLQTPSGGGGSGGNGDKSYNAQCIMWGDPHVITFDNMHYEFQEGGDYIAIKSLDDFTDSKLIAQARFVRMYNLGFDARTNSPIERISDINGFGASAGNIYTVKAAAVSEGTQTVAAYVYHYAEQARAKSSLFVVVKNTATSTINTIDVRTLTSAPTTVPLETGAQDSGTLALSGGRDVTITLQSGAVLTFNGFEATASMSANIAIKPSPTFYQNAGKLRGMCGDMDGQKSNDLHSRTDDTVTASEVAGASVGIGNDMCDVCNTIAKTWKVSSAADSLFDYGTITGVAAASMPGDDKMLPSLNDLASHRDAHLQGHVKVQAASSVDPAKLEQAKQSCKLLKPPFATDADYQNCINDFLVALQDVGADHAVSAIASFMNTQAQACRDSNGEDAAACSAAGAGCEALNGCSNMGYCDAGKCTCLPGRTGEDCSLPSSCDKNPCGRHGTCMASQNPAQPFDCQCDRGFGGDTCQYIITSMGKAVKLADDASQAPVPVDNAAEFTATRSQGLGAGTIAGIFVGIFLIGAAIMGGVVYYKKKNPGRFTMAAGVKPPLITSSDSENSRKGASAKGSDGTEMTPSPHGSPRGSTSKSYGRPPPSPRQYGAAPRGQM